MCNIASTACCSRTASPASRISSTAASSAMSTSSTASSGAIWTAHDGDRRHHAEERRLQRRRGSIGVFGGSQGTIQPIFEYGGTFDRTEYYVRRPYFGSPTRASKIADADYRRHSRPLGSGQVLRLCRPPSRRRIALPPHQRRVGRQLIKSPTIRASRLCSGSRGAPDRFVADQRESVRAELLQRALLAEVDWRARHAAVGLLPLQQPAISCPTRSAISQYNGVASNVFRSSFLNGVHGRRGYRVNSHHTLRFGFTGSGENATANNDSTVFPVDADGNVNGAPFVAPAQLDYKTGWLFGAYSPGRMAHHRQADRSTRAALRSDVRLCRREPVQPTDKRDL